MDRINTPTVARDLFGPGKHGFQDGDKIGGRPATHVSAAWCNDLQEALLRVIEVAQMAPESGNHELLLDAILWHIRKRIDDGDFAGADDLLAHLQDKDNPHNVTLAQLGAASAANLSNHIDNKNNPHGVTLAQLGAASAVDLSNHVSDRSNPHGVTLGQLGGAPLAGPVFTGNPRAPTPSVGDNDDSIATTAFVQAVLAAGVGWSQLLGDYGWCRMPNGLIVQWGSYLSTAPWEEGNGPTLNFALTFPNRCFCVVIADQNRNVGGDGWHYHDNYAQLTGWSNVGFSTFINMPGGSSDANHWDGLTYWAVGY